MICLFTVGLLLFALVGMDWLGRRRVIGSYLDALGRILAGDDQ